MLDGFLGIEFCGLYWHTELSPAPRDKNYHYNKYKKCLDEGIQLITIFQDEWKNRQHQVKNFLRSLLGKFDQRIYARKCIIKEIDKKAFTKFCDENHIQGGCNLTNAHFGLFYKDELVGGVSLGKHHRQNSNEKDVVLNRLCFKSGIQIVGGASRLAKKCIMWAKEKDYSKIISWSDNRWSSGKIYEIMGFTLEKELRPDYSYVDLKKTREGRLSKQYMRKKNHNIPDDITEWEYWALQRVARIWDCGKKRWVLNLQI